MAVNTKDKLQFSSFVIIIVLFQVVKMLYCILLNRVAVHNIIFSNDLKLCKVLNTCSGLAEVADDCLSQEYVGSQNI